MLGYSITAVIKAMVWCSFRFVYHLCLLSVYHRCYLICILQYLCFSMLPSLFIISVYCLWLSSMFVYCLSCFASVFNMFIYRFVNVQTYTTCSCAILFHSISLYTRIYWMITCYQHTKIVIYVMKLFSSSWNNLFWVCALCSVHCVVTSVSH